MKFFNRDRRTLLEKEIDNVLMSMKNEPPNTKAYANASANLKILYEAKATEKSNKLSKNTVANGLFSFGTVLMALYFEKFNIITTRATNFMFRGRAE